MHSSPYALVFIIGFAAGQLGGSNNEERPVGPITILPYPFPNNNGGSNDNSNRPNNLLSAFQNLFAANGAGNNNGGQPIQVQISTIRPPTNLLSILSGFINRPQLSTSTSTGNPAAAVTTQNPSSVATSTSVVPISTSATSTTSTVSGILPSAPTPSANNANNSTRAIYSTLPFNFTESANSDGYISPQDFVIFNNNQQ